MIVVINGSSVEVTTRTLSYGRIAEMVHETSPSVTWKLPNGTGGTLEKGDRIAVTEGLHISAYTTGNA